MAVAVFSMAKELSPEAKASLLAAKTTEERIGALPTWETREEPFYRKAKDVTVLIPTLFKGLQDHTSTDAAETQYAAIDDELTKKKMDSIQETLESILIRFATVSLARRGP